MTKFIVFDISFISVAFLLIVLMSIRIKKDTLSTSSKLYSRLLLITIFMLFMEFLSWEFNGKPGRFNYYANYLSNLIYEWSLPLIVCAWAAYMDYCMFKSIERLKKRWFYLQPMVVSTVIVVTNIFVPFVFSVDAKNIYHREPFIWVILLAAIITFIYICYLAVKNQKTIEKNIIAAMLLFMILPVISSVIQLFVYGYSVLWPTMAVAVVGTYIFLETISTSKDYLTGLVSRHRVDDYIDYLLREKMEFILIMIDLNDFKLINDTYGHLNGDLALKVFSKALSHNFKKARFIGRYAGDEFVIGIDMLSDSELKELDLQLERVLLEQENIINLPFHIGYSIGYEKKLKSDEINYETLIDTVDKKMYEDKLRKKTIQ